jgi:hypothetical protein
MNFVLVFVLMMSGCWTVFFPRPVSAEAAFEITRVEWSVLRSVLIIAGKGTSGAAVVIQNADSGVDLGSATIGKNRRWRLKVKDIDPVPCRVQATTDEQIQASPVSNAPADCGSVKPPPEVVVFGVEPDYIGWSMELFPSVTKSLPALLAAVGNEIK